MPDRTIQFLPHELGPPWERVRVEVDGELVSWMQTFTVGHRLRGVTLDCAGVVGVHTDDAHQMRGHMRFMLETVLQRAEGARRAHLHALRRPRPVSPLGLCHGDAGVQLHRFHAWR